MTPKRIAPRIGLELPRCLVAALSFSRTVIGAFYEVDAKSTKIRKVLKTSGKLVQKGGENGPDIR